MDKQTQENDSMEEQKEILPCDIDPSLRPVGSRECFGCPYWDIMNPSGENTGWCYK